MGNMWQADPDLEGDYGYSLNHRVDLMKMTPLKELFCNFPLFCNCPFAYF